MLRLGEINFRDLIHEETHEIRTDIDRKPGTCESVMEDTGAGTQEFLQG